MTSDIYTQFSSMHKTETNQNLFYENYAEVDPWQTDNNPVKSKTVLDYSGY